MKILYSPQRNDEVMDYSFIGEKIIVVYKGQTDTFDFTTMPDGKLESCETTLEINPIISGERINGELQIKLLYWYGINATEEEKFPTWKVI